MFDKAKKGDFLEKLLIELFRNEFYRLCTFAPPQGKKRWYFCKDMQDNFNRWVAH